MLTENESLIKLREHFGGITDPRKVKGKRHSLDLIMTIAILAAICNCDEWTEIEEFGNSKKVFFEELFDMPYGIPSHDTFGMVFRKICPEEFGKCFVSWVNSLVKIDGDIVNIDGKCLRRSYDTDNDKSAIYMVSAWANKNNMVLGQRKVGNKSNEITAIPKLLGVLDLVGSLVTIDAMGTQKEIASQIIDSQADYLLALKGNQSSLHEEVKDAFSDVSQCKQIQEDREVDAGHGRVEERRCQLLPASDYISKPVLDKWKGVETIVRIESYVYYKNGKQKGKRTYEERFYISSLPCENPTKINQAVRSHWGIETKLHWVLDVAFNEDNSRVRKGYAPENFATIKHIAINKLKNEKTLKRGIKCKRKKAGWDNDYLLKVLDA